MYLYHKVSCKKSKEIMSEKTIPVSSAQKANHLSKQSQSLRLLGIPIKKAHLLIQIHAPVISASAVHRESQFSPTKQKDLVREDHTCHLRSKIQSSFHEVKISLLEKSKCRIKSSLILSLPPSEVEDQASKPSPYQHRISP